MIERAKLKLKPVWRLKTNKVELKNPVVDPSDVEKNSNYFNLRPDQIQIMIGHKTRIIHLDRKYLYSIIIYPDLKMEKKEGGKT
jgi:hypothetical protein